VIYPGKFDRDNGYIFAWGAQLESGTSPTPYQGGGDDPPAQDTTPPAAPTGLTASLVSGSVNLSWNANSESDLSHYRLERSVNGTGSFGLLASPTVTTHVDGSVSAGSTYYYRVFAVDTAGNVSAPSSTVSVTVASTPPPPSGALNVLDYGASTATSGDDAPAIQRAFDAAASQGKDVYFPTGYYWLSKTVYFRVSGRAVFGDGTTKSIIAGNTNSYGLLQMDRTEGSVVRDLRLEGSHLNDGSVNVNKAIECYVAKNTLIQRVHAYGTGYAVFDNGGTNTTFEDSVCEDYGRIGFLINDGGIVRRSRFLCRDGWNFSGEMHGVYAPAGRANVTIEDNEFTGCGAYAVQLWGSQSGVWTENITIQRNTFTRCKGILVVGAGSSGPSYRNVRFLGNTIRQALEKSIRIIKFNGSNSNGTGFLIDGNVFEDCGTSYGVFFNNSDAPITGVRISNNQFLAPTRSPWSGMIYVTKGSGAMSDVIIENNLFQDIGRVGNEERSCPGIYLNSGSGITVRSNTFYHWSGSGKSYVVEGVRWDVAVMGVSIAQNQFYGNGLAHCYGVRVTSTGSSTNGSITNNTFRNAKLLANGVPNSGNTFE
jgi:hypothetical protein